MVVGWLVLVFWCCFGCELCVARRVLCVDCLFLFVLCLRCVLLFAHELMVVVCGLCWSLFIERCLLRVDCCVLRAVY